MALELTLNPNSTLDCITVGRANIDLYPDEGESLDYTRKYNVYVGGSPANIAVGISRMGLKAGFITRVSKDKHGKFVHNYLSNNFGVDLSHIQWDENKGTTSLAFAECKVDAETILYRNSVADLRLDSDLIDEQYIASSKIVLVSGTALTKSPSRDAVFKILEYAKAHKVITALDIDYRPYGWTSNQEATNVFSSIITQCDIVIGTREEFDVVGFSQEQSDEDCSDFVIHNGAKLVIIKRGMEGSMCSYVQDNHIYRVQGKVFLVDVKKPYGAGDAFASCFISMLIKSKDLSYSLRAAAASASINISRYSCTEAMPSEDEVIQFLSRRDA